MKNDLIQSARRGGQAARRDPTAGKRLNAAVADASYVKDSGIDRDALAARNRAILLAGGMTEAEADRLLSAEGGSELARRERDLDRLGRFAPVRRRGPGQKFARRRSE